MTQLTARKFRDRIKLAAAENKERSPPTRRAEDQSSKYRSWKEVRKHGLLISLVPEPKAEFSWVQPPAVHFLSTLGLRVVLSRFFSHHEEDGSISAGLAVHLRDVRLMLCTIFWIFSSFFRMLAFTAQILSCWSLICCSSSASSAFRGSTALSVMLVGNKQWLISVLRVRSVSLPPLQKPAPAKGCLASPPKKG